MKVQNKHRGGSEEMQCTVISLPAVHLSKATLTLDICLFLTHKVKSQTLSETFNTCDCIYGTSSHAKLSLHFLDLAWQKKIHVNMVHKSQIYVVS